MKHQERIDLAQARERKVNSKLLQIITQCAVKGAPLPTHAQIAEKLKVNVHNIAKGIRTLVRSESITRLGTRSAFTYRVNVINMTTARQTYEPANKAMPPKPEIRKPSPPPTLAWLAKADAALKRIDDNWGPVKDRFDVLRDKQARLDNSPQGLDEGSNREPKGTKEADTLKVRVQCDRECDGLQEGLDGEQVEEGDIDNPSLYDDVSFAQQYAPQLPAGRVDNG